MDQPAHTSMFSRSRQWLHRQDEAYRNGQERPLAGYLALLGGYAGGTAAAAVVARGLGRRAPRNVQPWDLLQLALATHKLSRMISKDPVTSPLRAPFTQYAGLSAPGELREEVRGHGLQHSVGELLTCPMCLAQWVATAFAAGLVLAPTATRMAMATLSAVAGADFLQQVYAYLQQAVD